MAYADSVSRTEGQPRRARRGLPAASAGPQGRQNQGQAGSIAGHCGSDVADANGGGLPIKRLTEHGDEQGEPRHISDGCSPWRRWQGSPELASHWGTEPKLGRLAHGIPSRVDRLRCLGNAVVPQIVELIGRAIIQSQEVES
jgi:hypothetical protein